jgi:Na+/H+-dicarboxylate symporter
VLAGLAAGLAAGAAAARWHPPSAGFVAAVTDVIGTVWINAIRMTVVPLVVSLVAGGIASITDLKMLRLLGGRAFATYLAILSTMATMAFLVGSTAMRLFPVTRGPAPAATAAPPAASGVTQWLTSLIPINPVQAAAEGALLPLIIFTIAFGSALLFIEPSARELITKALKGVSDAMLIVLGWVLWISPVGVFALAFSLASKAGASTFGAIGYYVALLSVTLALGTILLYPIAVTFGGVTATQLWQALAPAQAIAISSRSSLATLPVLIDSADTRLGFPREVTAFVLPLTATMFRLSGAIAMVVAGLFVGRYFDLPYGPGQYATLLILPVLLSFSVPGVPNGSFIAMLPLFEALSLPMEIWGVLLAVDLIPDVFKTVLNATAHMTAALIISKPTRQPKAARQSAF